MPENRLLDKDVDTEERIPNYAHLLYIHASHMLVCALRMDRPPGCPKHLYARIFCAYMTKPGFAETIWF